MWKKNSDSVGGLSTLRKNSKLNVIELKLSHPYDFPVKSLFPKIALLKKIISNLTS